MNTLEILQVINSECGVEIWNTPSKAISAYRDIAPKDKRVIKLLKELCDSGACEILMLAIQGNPDSHILAYHKAISVMQNNSLYTREAIACLCYDFCIAAGITLPGIIRGSESSANQNIPLINWGNQKLDDSTASIESEKQGIQVDNKTDTVNAEVQQVENNTHDESMTDTENREEITLWSLFTSKSFLKSFLITLIMPFVVFFSWGLYTEKTTTLGFKESLIYNYSCLAGTLNEGVGKITGSYEGARIAYKIGDEVYPGGYTTQRLAVIDENENVTETSQNGNASGHEQSDEASMLEIVWTVFSSDDVAQVYCADFDHNGWYEAFVEKKLK